jgi:hypothetical protein
MQRQGEGGQRLGVPQRRVVLLGASNLTRGIATVIEAACQAWGRPLDVLAALGHGRSYGMRSAVLARALPGILECGLWRALEQRDTAPTAALITDIGNDLFYGASPQMIARWVDECCRRLAAFDARLVMTRLPVCNIGRVQSWQYLAFRTLSYPRCRLSLGELVVLAQELDELLLELAGKHQCRLIEPRVCWYGLDPVHVKMSESRAAWSEIFAGWTDTVYDAAPRAPLARWCYLLTRAPEHRWLFGREQSHTQPNGRLPDGTTISFY